jgi:DNA segregation ATPase FtsK/SpoIIIE, S-DNA-T family
MVNPASMIFNRGNARRTSLARRPLPPKLARVVAESWWLILVALAVYLLLVLFTYSKGDPGWSHSVAVERVHNSGGRVGAWIADMLLYLFGLSAYWWAAGCLCMTYWGYRRLGAADGEERFPLIPASGFLLLILSSASFEALRLHSLKVALPLAPGGMLGMALSGSLSRWFGFAGCSVTLIILMGIGFSLLTGLSWLAIFEKVGEYLERFWFASVERWRDWQDRRIGVAAAQRREEVVAEDKKHMEVREPLRIEVPQMAIQKSDRVVKEKQRPLFEDLPDSPLPPLHLLDEPPAAVEVMSAETLEYTSRSIEKKLLDFGVEVKVVAAYPGPVVTRYEVEPAVGVKGSQITNLSRDLARALSVSSIRVVENIPGKSCMGMEIPNPKRQNQSRGIVRVDLRT